MPKKSRLTFDAETHSYTLRGLPIPSVTQILDWGSEYANLPPEIIEPARERGTLVHEITASFDTYGDTTVSEAVSARWYLDAWRKFKEDTEFYVHDVELQVVSERHLFAGTLDRVGNLGGYIVIVDIKTSSAVNPLVALQLAAYQHAYNEERKPKATKRYAVQLKPDGTYRLHEYKDPGDWSAFLAMLTLRNWALKYR